MSADPAGGAARAESQLTLLYDGVCGLCNRTVRFVSRRDRRDRFRFAPLQGPAAAEILRRHGKNPEELDTFYLVFDRGGPGERIVGRGRAVLGILRGVGGPWRLFCAFAILPTWLLDAAYGLVARRRYRIFGKLDACPLPAASERHKFLDPPP